MYYNSAESHQTKRGGHSFSMPFPEVTTEDGRADGLFNPLSVLHTSTRMCVRVCIPYFPFT